MTKYFYLAAWLAILTTFGFLLTVFYWLTYPYDVISFKYDKLPILNENHIIHRGETILWMGNHEHYTNGVHVRVSRQIVCASLINLPETSYVTVKGHFESINSSVVIPSNAPEGVCHIDIQSIFGINPIRTISIHKLTEDFTIVK